MDSFIQHITYHRTHSSLCPGTILFFWQQNPSQNNMLLGFPHEKPAETVQRVRWDQKIESESASSAAARYKEFIDFAFNKGYDADFGKKCWERLIWVWVWGFGVGWLKVWLGLEVFVKDSRTNINIHTYTSRFGLSSRYIFFHYMLHGIGIFTYTN